MKVIYGLNQARRVLQRKNPVLAIGIFDGLHLGHQYLIKQMIRRARTIGGTAVVMTFDPHPIHVLRPDIDLPLLIPLSYRLELIESIGAEACWVVRFNRSFAKLTPEQFIRHYLVDKIGTREIFVGDDFRFGQNRSGNLELFEAAGGRYGFKVNIVRAVQRGGQVISSTRIRKHVREGKLNEAGRLLGRRVAIVGKVVKGDARGKRLGYPTANIEPLSDTVPPPGVYLVRVVVNGRRHAGMANIGTRPSFPTKENRIHIEAHILDFKKNIYGQTMTIEILKKIRNEKTFPSEQRLTAQLRRDEIKARKLFAKLS